MFHAREYSPQVSGTAKHSKCGAGNPAPHHAESRLAIVPAYSFSNSFHHSIVYRSMNFWTDLRFGARQLLKSPGFTLTVLATLALCIGVNTAIYTVVSAVLLRPVPYPEPERLAMVVTSWRNGGRQGIDDSQTGTQFEAVRQGASGLDVAAYSGVNGANFADNGFVEYVFQQRVSTGYFRVLGIAPQIGREFTPLEDGAGGPPVAILSYPFWQRAFHGENVAGRAVKIRGEPYTIVGIMPRGFRTDTPVDLWTPLRPSRSGEGSGSNYGVVARLRPGVSWAQALAQLKVLSQGLALEGDAPKGSTVEVSIERFNTVSSDLRTELLFTWAAVLMVLLIGCVNVAGLLLARSATRRREIATRMALGGSRQAVIRQLLAESLLLATAGGALGIGLGAFVLEGLKALGARNFELWHPLALDLRVLLAMLAVALFTSLVFGLVPAVEASRIDIRSVLVEGGRGSAGGRRSWLRGAMVTAEVALSLVLLVSAGLLVRTLVYLDGLNPGFDTRNVLTAQTSLQDARYKTHEQVNGLFTQSLDRIRSIPGVESAAVALTLPFERPLNDSFKFVEGGVIRQQMTEEVYVTPDYFSTMRIPVLRGRSIRYSDTASTRKVAVVSESFARKFFPGKDAIGRALGSQEIVGIVGDVQQHSGMGHYGPLSIEPTLYIAAAQTSDSMLQLVHTWFPPKWVVRAQGRQSALAAEMQRAVASVDPQLPVANFRAIDQLRAHVTQDQRYHAVLFSMLAGLALLLAAVGLYGLISHSVTQRTREMGIRMALGATAKLAIGSAMKPGIVFAASGVVLGILLALGAVRSMRHFLWGVRPLDPLTFVIAALLLLGVAVVATLLPTLRILHLDPARTLRDE